jgi:hypothetical protein
MHASSLGLVCNQRAHLALWVWENFTPTTTNSFLLEHRNPWTAKMFLLFFGGPSAILEFALTVSNKGT